MENCFRFLINVDQCLNMSYFDIFFYRLKSEHKFHVSNAQIFSAQADTSLRSAVRDIRLYLDKYPYHVEDFQIITAMRSTFDPHPSRWEDTLLYRLLLMDQELRRARIFINSREGVDKALNLVMLYDVDFSADLPHLENYMNTRRLEHDCSLLLALSAPVGTDREFPAGDSAAAELLAAFRHHQKQKSDQLRQLRQHLATEAEEPQQDSEVLELARFIRNQLFNFQIFEVQIDRNNRRKNILALLRLTEYINRSTAPADSERGKTTLSQRCSTNWTRVWSDPELEHRYATMLQGYRQRLTIAAMELERPSFTVGEERTLPTLNIPADNAITCDDSVFFDDQSRENGTDLQKILGDFLENKLSIRTLGSAWDETYEKCKLFLEKMDYALKDCAESLSRQYSAALEQRKKESILWRTSLYTAAADTEKEISQLDHERDCRLELLKSPHMTPSLSFQDQLNMQNSLEQGNRTVRFCIRCISAMTAVNFLMLLLVCALVCFGHYTFLQPYVFQSGESLVYYLAYLAAILVMMLLCWTMPYRYFQRKLRKCIKQLQKDAEKYIAGYYAKAGYFRTYINLLNQLDYITRHHRLRSSACDTSHRLSQGYLWHKVQIRQHLQKLQFFRGLIELGDMPQLDPTEQIRPAIDGNKVCDVIDSPIYWPGR